LCATSHAEVANGFFQLLIGRGQIGLCLLDIGLGRADVGLDGTDLTIHLGELLTLLMLFRSQLGSSGRVGLLSLF
jgi:hypothetical protein